MMRFISGATRCLMLLAVALSTTACGGVQPTVSVTPGAAPVNRFSGTWAGRFPGSSLDGVFLTLKQQGNRIIGEGALFRQDNPQPLSVWGTATDQVALLDLEAYSSTGVNERDRLFLRLSQNQAEGTLSGSSLPQEVSFTLARSTPIAARTAGDARLRLWDNVLVPFGQLSPPEVYRVSGTVEFQPYPTSVPQKSACEFRVTLTDTGQDEYRGNWQALNDDSKLALGLTTGRVSATNNLWGDWSRIAFQDETTVLNLGSVWFRRIGGGQAATSTPVDPDSLLNHQQGLLPLSGAITLEAP